MNARLVSLLALTLSSPLAAQTWSTSAIQPARTFMGSTSCGDQAFFAGGGHPFVGYDDAVNVYDATVGPPTDPAAWSSATLSQPRSGLVATCVDGQVLFAGGAHQGFSQSVSDVVDLYDVGTATWSTASLSEPRNGDSATSVAGFAFFCGGDPNPLGDPGPSSDRIDVYEAATGTWSTASLSVARVGVKATAAGPYALFGGGQLVAFGAATDIVDVYDSSVGPPSDSAAWSVAQLSQTVTPAAAVSVGGKAFFAGGDAEIAPGLFQTVATVDVYDSSVGPPSDPAAWSVESLSAPRVFLSATSVGGQAFFAGGVDFSSGYDVFYDSVDVYDSSSDTWTVESLSVPRLPFAASAGPYALFAGGHDEGWVFYPYGTVDAREIVDGPTVYCTPKTSSAGCVAVLSTTTSSSPVSGAGGYAVTGSDIQGGKNGILFAGISGPVAIPFSGGTLCVSPPTKRGPITNAGGSGPNTCDGSLSTEINDGAILPFGLDVGSGNTGWYQYWYRDPNNGVGSLGSALSAGIEIDFL